MDEDAHLNEDGTAPPTCAEKCADDNPCTADLCQGDGCEHRAAADGPAPLEEQLAGDCRRIECQAGAPLFTVDDLDRPDDTACADGACNEGAPAPIPRERGASCGEQGGAFCDGKGLCVECLIDEHCTSPDICGGAGEPGFCGCRPQTCSELGLTCGTVPDGCYQALHCDNAKIDGDESDVDCGGLSHSCVSRCANGKTCGFGDDCLSGFCAAGKCSGAWSDGFGDPSAQHVRAVANDAAGNMVVVGEFSGTVDFGNGPMTSAQGAWQLYVAKFASTGVALWSRHFGENAVPSVSDVGVDPAGNIVLAGWFTGELDFGAGPLVSGAQEQGYVAKLDDLGNPLWSIPLSVGLGSSSQAAAIALRTSGEIVVVGQYQGSLSVGNANLQSTDGLDAFVLELNSAGGLSDFARSFGAPGQQRAIDVAVSPTGKVAVAGNFTGSVAFGNQVHVSKGDWDAFLVLLDDGGTPMWSKSFGHAGQQTASAVAVDAEGKIVVGGSYFQGIDFGLGFTPSVGADDIYVVRFASDGGPLWGYRYGDSQSQDLADLEIDSRGDIVLAGTFAGSIGIGTATLVSAGGTDVFVAKLDDQGGSIWGRRYGDSSAQLARELSITPFGGVLLVGEFAGSIDFGQGALPSAGSSDVFVAALPP